MKNLPAIVVILFLAQCDRNDSSFNPFVNISDTLPAITIPSNNRLPLIVVGNGSGTGITAELLEQAIDSLGKIKKGGVISFSTGGEAITIPLTRSLKIISPDSFLVIDGGNLITLDGQKSCRIIECKNYARLVLTNIRLVNGVSDSSGGALLHPWYGSLNCYNVTFVNNRCTTRGPEFGGGAVFAGGLGNALFVRCSFSGNYGSNGGAILNRGTNLVIDSCTFKNNVATGNGGGKDAGGSGQGGLGGAVYIDGMNYNYAQPFYLRYTTFSGNISHCHGSAVFSYYYKNKPGVSGALIEACEFDENADSGTLTSTGTLYHEGAPLKLHSSTFAGNTTKKHAGALFLGPDATTEIVNCTFYKNKTPGNGGAIFGGIQKISIVNCTFYGNEGSYGPAIFNDVPEAVTIRNTLFVNNVPIVNPYAYCNCTVTYTNGNHVIQWPQDKTNGKADNPCINGAVFTDPNLDSLSNNGGFTRTMVIDNNSPAAGICESCPSTDQRGVVRKERCDAGAFESR
jgi:hypothetical protein